MASGPKRLTAFVVDVGPGMREADPGGEPGDPTPLQKTVGDLGMVLQRKIFSEERKSVNTKSEVCLVLFGTDDTDNPLAEEQGGDSYRHIKVSRGLAPASWELVDHVTNGLPMSECEGDFLEAIIVAVDQLHRAQELAGPKKQFACDVVVFSNLTAHFGDDQLDRVIPGLKKLRVDLKVIGPQFDSPDDSQGTRTWKGKVKTQDQRANEGMIQEMLERGVSGGTWHFDDIASLISNFQSRMKQPRPMHYVLEMGSSFQISVSLFTNVAKTKVNDGRPWKDFYARDPDQVIEKETSYVLNNETRDEVAKEDRVKMWSYGSRLVPITDDELDAMRFKAGEKCLRLLGFTKLDETTHVPSFVWTGDSVKVVLPRKDDETAAVSYRALVESMLEQNVAMILRFVYQARSKPRLVLAVPVDRDDFKHLVLVNCPFSEDIRDYQFPSLEVERLEPSVEQLDAVGRLMDAFDLTADDEDEGRTYHFQPELTLNPYLQRMYQCISHRVQNPDAGLPSFHDDGERAGFSLNPRSEMISSDSTKKVLSKIKSLFPLKKVASKKEKRRADDVFDVAGDGDPGAKRAKLDDRITSVSDLMSSGARPLAISIGARDPVADFEDLISRAASDEDVDFHLSQLFNVSFQLAIDSLGTSLFPRALQCLVRGRHEAMRRRRCLVYNNFVRKLESRLRGEGVVEFWRAVQVEAANGTLDLISRREAEDSDVDPESVRSVFEEEKQKTVVETKKDDDDDDLFDMM